MRKAKDTIIFGQVLILSFIAVAHAQNYDLNWPLSNSQTPDVITSTFGIRYNSNPGENYDFHKGFDLSASTGTPVFASYNGKVLWTTVSPTGGIMMAVAYSDLTKISCLNMRYLHLNDTVVVSNATITKGDLIAYSGNTGQSSGPHLHLETYPSFGNVRMILADFPDAAIRTNPVRYFPNIDHVNPPSIILDSVRYYTPPEVDQMFLHIEVSNTEMDLKDLHIRCWDPVHIGLYSQVTFSLEEDKVYIYNNSSSPTTEYQTEDTKASDFFDVTWCEDGNYCCASLYIEPENFTGSGPFKVDILLDPWIPENSYL
jgi:hypothetical protein